MRSLTLNALGGLLITAVAWLPLMAANQSPGEAVPGSLNYVEGSAAIGKQVLGPNSVGSVVLEAGQVLNTKSGKAEILLTPGVFVRIGDHSSLQMISPSLTDTEVALQRGQATVEVTDIYRQNDLVLDDGGARTQLLKLGFYEFDSNPAEVHVFDGEALVRDQDQSVKVKAGHDLVFSSNSRMKSQKFDKASFNSNDLYQWSTLRSSYLSEANIDEAQNYTYDDWFFDGWYWDPWFDCYTFIPGDGIFFSPFGWGFYSPWYVGWAPTGFDGHYYHRFDPQMNAVNRSILNSNRIGGHGFRGSPRFGMSRGFYGGGFHGGFGGGFHGGGFGGGGHR